MLTVHECFLSRLPFKKTAMSSVPKSYLTPQEYLDIERAAEFRSAYYRGEMFAMTGASRKHNLICANLTIEIGTQFKGRRCEVYQSDMRVRVSDTGLYTYPDVVAVCGDPKFDDDHFDVLSNPQVLIEVLSDSTESYDRGSKFEKYRKIESLQDYILISQNGCAVERFTRQPNNQWLMWSTTDMMETLEVASIDCSIKIEDIYAKIEFGDNEASAS